MIEEAEKRDHRKLGRQLDLFHLQDEAPGMVFWHAKGWTLWQQVEQYMRPRSREHGYQEVKTPQIVDRSLWEKSGHWANVLRPDVHHAVGEARLRGQADELPVPHPDLQPGPEELPRPAAAHGRVRLLPPQRALRRRCTASCGCATSCRTTRTSSAPRARCRPSPPSSSACCSRSTPDFGFTDVQVKLSTSSGEARRHRRAVGRRRGGARRCARRAAVWSTNCSRARAPSTARRSSSP